MKVSSCKMSVSPPNTTYDDRGDERHQRQVPGQRIAHRERQQGSSDEEDRGGGEDAGVLASRASASGRNGLSSGANSAGRELTKKNTQQRPEIEHELYCWVVLRFGGHARIFSSTFRRCHSVLILRSGRSGPRRMRGPDDAASLEPFKARSRWTLQGDSERVTVNCRWNKATVWPGLRLPPTFQIAFFRSVTVSRI